VTNDSARYSEAHEHNSRQGNHFENDEKSGLRILICELSLALRDRLKDCA
jgi:hypothetical protein